MNAGPDIPLDPIFELHEDYPHLMAGPHRRRVAQIAVPALTRHLVFWKPIDWAGYNPSKKPSRERARGIDTAICDIYKSLLALQRRKITRYVQSNGVLRGEDRAALFDSFMRTRDGRRIEREETREHTGADAHRTVRFTFEWHRIKATIYFENHVEFVTATTILDFSSYLRPGEISYRKRDPIFALLHAHLEAIAAAKVEEGRMSEIHADLFRDVWHQFDQQVLRRMRRHKERLGKAIADFRGLILGVNYDLRKKDARREPGQTTIARPFTRQPTPAHENTNEDFSPKWPAAEFKTIWEVLGGGAKGSDTETTASYFLDGRAFYATSLGDQSELDSKRDPDPVFYLVYENTNNMWQLGRLIYRINMAGTLRVLAVMHFERLREVGGGLLRAGTALDEALGRAAPPDHGDEDSIKEARRQVRLDYERVEQPMRPFVDVDVDGPIYERIERSRHYAAQFRTMAARLRIRRVDGYQPYNEFVEQKLGPVFEYIDRLGRRYAQVQRDRALLFRRLQALDALYGERVISEAQYIADVALFGILGPYYVGSVVTKILHDPYDQNLAWIWMGAFGIASIIPITVLRLLERVPSWRAEARQRAFKKGWRSVVGTRIGRVLLAGTLASLAVVAARQPWWPDWMSPSHTSNAAAAAAAAAEPKAH